MKVNTTNFASVTGSKISHSLWSGGEAYSYTTTEYSGG